MIRIRQLREADSDLIISTVRHPKVYPHVTDDMCPPAEAWMPTFEPGLAAYMGAWDDDLFLGLWVCVRQNGVTVEVHTCLLPCAAGSKGREAANFFREWLWSNTEFKRIETAVPVSNTVAIRFAKRAGMVQYAVRPKSFLKNGKLEDEVLLGVSKPESEG